MARVSRANKSFHDSGVSFSINMDSVIESMAGLDALIQSTKGRAYLDAIVDEAFEEADSNFNTAAEAYAKATGHISHMYEWGTIGINKGRTNSRLPASNPNARLWHTFTEGAGLNRTVWFAFKPSVAFSPKPTKQDTNMDPDIIAKMRDHVFRWKARVMETGEAVTINPKRAKFLLLPVYKKDRARVRPNDAKRGYTLSAGPIVAHPGYYTYGGEFFAFWNAFWQGEGIDMVDRRMLEVTMKDFSGPIGNPRTSASVRPIGTFLPTQEIKKKSKKIQAEALRKARSRKKI